MIQIYAPNNTDYSVNGDMVIFPEVCESKKDLDGMWSMEMSHPLDEEGRWKAIVEEAVIAAPAGQLQDQLFRIKVLEKTDTEIVAKAYPVFFDAAEELFLYDVRPTNASGQEALDAMTAGSRFSGESDIAEKATAYFENRNMIDCLNGNDEPTFRQRWGGEIIYDNYKVVVNERIGSDNGAEVRYGKNMAHINYQVDMSSMCTRIIPVAYNGRQHSSVYIDSQNIDKYAKIYHKKVKFEHIRLIDDVKKDEEEDYLICNSQEELDAALQEACEGQFELGLDLPKVTIAVDMIMLSNTEEYKDFVEIEKIGLGDTVSCYNRDLDITTKARAIEVVWDCIEDCAKSVVLGDYKYDYFGQVNSTIHRIESAIRPNGTIVAERVKGILNAMETSLRLQSSAARKVDGRAFLIEDTDLDSELYGAMEAGTQGLRIANSLDAEGNWDWKTALTAAGLIADVIVAGLLTDRTGDNSWDLDQGVLMATNLAVEESIATDRIQCEEIVNAGYPKTLTTNPIIYVNVESGDDDNICMTGAVFQTLQGAINSIPKFLNGRTVYVELQTDVIEDITLNCFTAGRIFIYLAGHSVYGFVRSMICPVLGIYGGTKANGGADMIGIIHPSEGVETAGYTASVRIDQEVTAYLSKLKVIGADIYAGETGKNVCVACQYGTTYVDDVEVSDTDVGFRANALGRIYSSKSSGVATQYGFAAASGGTISLNSDTQSGGVVGDTTEYTGGTVKYHNPVFDDGSASESGGSASTGTVNKTVTYKSSRGNAIQNYGGSSAKWRSDSVPKVGDYGYGDHVAFWFFGDQFENIADKNVSKIEITFTRNSGGYSSAVVHDFYAHGYETQPSTTSPSYDSSKIGSASVATGDSTTTTITDPALINAIKAKKGICSIPPSQSKAYYSVMSGVMKIKFYFSE